MTERRVLFADWVGQAVMVFYPGGNIPVDYGVLDEVNDWGLVLNHPLRISWPTGGLEDPSEQDVRYVSEFRPWHMVSGVRLLEPEEKRSLGL